jgi:hypothetical protein
MTGLQAMRSLFSLQSKMRATAPACGMFTTLFEGLSNIFGQIFPLRRLRVEI